LAYRKTQQDFLKRGILAMERSVLMKVDNVSKDYQMGEVSVNALQGASFDIYDGEFIVILGPSGSGKSTLLNILGGMDLPSEGKVTVKDEEINKYNDRKLTAYRRDKVGFVFQFYNLMANLTAKENVELATEICKESLDIDKVMEEVGLEERKNHFPSQMSGGEQQRVAIARAVAKNPLMLLCDEPTGALDYKTGLLILSLLHKINRQHNKTVVIITHNMAIGDMADRVIKMRSGRIVEIKENENPIPPERIEW
jgi:putative ABC transport system ATP-binding protein